MQRIMICSLLLACLLAVPARAQWDYDMDDLPALLDMLESDQPAVRQLGATGLGLIDSFFAQVAVPALTAQLNDEDEQARLAAAWTLGCMGEAGATGLIAALDSNDVQVRLAATAGLSRSNLPAADVITAGLGYYSDVPLTEYGEVEQGNIAIAYDIARKVWESELEPAAAMLAAVADIDDYSASIYEIRLLEAMARAIARAEENPVPILLEALSSDNATVRGVSVMALGELVPDSKLFLPRFIELLDDDAYFVRRMSAYAIAQVGPSAAEAIPHLIANIPETEDWRNDWPVAGALAAIGAPAVPALAKLVTGDDENLCYTALHTFELMGPAGYDALPVLLDAMSWQDMSLSKQAGKAVAAIAVYDPVVFDRLLAMLADSTPEGRTAAAIALRDLHPPATAAIPALTQALKDDDLGVREHAIFALQELSASDEASIQALVDALADEQVRMYAATALYQLGGVAVPALASALAQDDAAAREAAAGILGDIGLFAWEAIPALVVCLADEDGLVRKRAAHSIGLIHASADEAVPALLAASRGDDYALKLEAIQALGFYGANAAEAVPLLAELVSSDDMFVQEAAIMALGRIGPAAVNALDELEALLADPAVAELAQRAIEIIQGAENAPAEPEPEQ